MPTPSSAAARQRILEAAGRQFFAHGFHATTMDDLAAELGMSKKTLYRHFAGKEPLVAALVDRKAAAVREGLQRILDEPGLGFALRARRVFSHTQEQLAEIHPVFLRDLQRHAPAVYRRMEDIRRAVLPAVWERLLREGRRAGLVRPDADPAFAAHVVLAAVQGMLQPAMLDECRLAPRAALERTLDLLLGGLLTPAGRRDYENTAP